jgi:hypothetical protein
LGSTGRWFRLLARAALCARAMPEHKQVRDICMETAGARGDCMRFEQVREFALALPEVAEEPHFTLTSFRVQGKIFATAPLDQSSVNIFVADMDRERALAIDPVAFEKLWWGSSVVGLKAHIAQADPKLISELLKLAWQRKASSRLKKDHGDVR